MPSDPLENLFEQREPVVREIYDRLLKQVGSWKGVVASPKKTSIHLDRRTSFAGVHPKKKWLDLNIRLAEPLKNSRVAKSEQISKNRFHHLVRLHAPTDVDRELIGWLRTAYDLSE